MPGSSARHLEKARSGVLPADSFILDLEDAVAPTAKAQARANVAAAVAQKGFGRSEVVVRVNGPDTPWFQEDVDTFTRMEGVHALALPKVETADMVRAVADRLQPAQSLFCMLETPRGVLQAAAIAAASPRVSALVMGTSDLTNELHALHTADRAPLWMSLQLCVLAARANNLMALDGVHLKLKDLAEFEAHCEQGRAMGFDGKTLIHPDTIALANRCFGPTAEEVAHARRVVEAFEAASREGRGVVVLDGRLIENLHVEGAHRTLALADALS
eukprot:EG_transcript_18209